MSVEVAKEVEASIDRKSDIEVRTACEDMFEDGTVDPVYQAKARLLNSAIQEIGMGRYQVRRVTVLCELRLTLFSQWYLFIVAGFGWFACVYSLLSSNIPTELYFRHIETACGL